MGSSARCSVDDILKKYHFKVPSSSPEEIALGGAPAGDESVYSRQGLNKLAATPGVFNKGREDLIQDMFALLVKVFGLKHNPATTPKEEMIKILKEKIPSPSSWSINKSNNIQTKVCDSLVSGINAIYKRTVIPKSASPSERCRMVGEILYSLFTCVQAEFLASSADIQQTLKNLEVVRGLVDKIDTAMYTQVLKTVDVNSATGQRFTSIHEVKQELLAKLDHLHTILANLVGNVISPTQDILINRLKESNDFTGIVNDISEVIGTDEFGDRLAFVISGVASVAESAHLVDKALKDIGVSIAEYKKVSNAAELRELLLNAIKSPKNSAKPLGDLMRAFSVIQAVNANQKDISGYLGGMDVESAIEDIRAEHTEDGSVVGGGPSFVNEVLDRVTRGDYRNDLGTPFAGRSQTARHSVMRQLNESKKLQKLYLNEVEASLARSYNRIIGELGKISAKFGNEIALTTDAHFFMDQWRNFRRQQPDRENLHIALLGAASGVDSLENKNRFLDTLLGVATATEGMLKTASKPHFEELNRALNSLMEDILAFQNRAVGIMGGPSVETYKKNVTDTRAPFYGGAGDVALAPVVSGLLPSLSFLGFLSAGNVKKPLSQNANQYVALNLNTIQQQLGSKLNLDRVTMSDLSPFVVSADESKDDNSLSYLTSNPNLAKESVAQVIELENSIQTDLNEIAESAKGLFSSSTVKTVQKYEELVNELRDSLSKPQDAEFTDIVEKLKSYVSEAPYGKTAATRINLLEKTIQNLGVDESKIQGKDGAQVNFKDFKDNFRQKFLKAIKADEKMMQNMKRLKINLDELVSPSEPLVGKAVAAAAIGVMAAATAATAKYAKRVDIPGTPKAPDKIVTAGRLTEFADQFYGGNRLKDFADQFYGGEDDLIAIKNAIGGLSSSFAYFKSLERAVAEMDYYFRIANIRKGLYSASESFDEYTKNYVDVLGEEAAFMIDQINDRYERLVNSLNDSGDHADKLWANTEQVAYTKPLGFNLKSCVNGANPLLIADTYKEGYLLALDYIRSAKKEMIEALQAIDIHLSKFTKGIQQKPDAAKELLELIEPIMITHKFFTEKSGDILVQAFQFFQSVQNTPVGGDGRSYDIPDLFGLADNIDPTIHLNRSTAVAITQHYYNALAAAGHAVGPDSIGQFFLPRMFTSQQVKELLETLEKAFRMNKALENVFLIFSNAKVGGEQIDSFLDPARILRAFIKYAIASSIGVGVVATCTKSRANGHTGGAYVDDSPDTKLFTKINTYVLDSARAYVNLAALPARAGGVAAMAVNNRNRAQDYLDDPQFLTHNASVFAKMAIGLRFAGDDNGWVKWNKEHYIKICDPFEIPNMISTDKLFEMGVKSLVTKVMGIIGLYSLFRKPSKNWRSPNPWDSVAFVNNPIRQIMGGSSEVQSLLPVEIYDDAVELYIRIPLLAEWYREVFRFSANSPAMLISMIPQVNNVWADLIKVVFIEGRSIEEGGYPQTYANRIIKAINDAYNHYKFIHKTNTVLNIIQEFIKDINRRYGVFMRSELERFQSESDAAESPIGYNSKDRIDYNLIDIDSVDSAAVAPSDKYLRFQKGKSTPSTKRLQALDDFYKAVRAFRQSIEVNLTLDNLNQEDRTRSYSAAFEGQIGFGEMIQKIKRRVHKAPAAEDKYKIVYSNLHGMDRLSDVDQSKLLMFHESVVLPLTMLFFVYRVLNEHNKLLTCLNTEGLDGLIDRFLSNPPTARRAPIIAARPVDTTPLFTTTAGGLIAGDLRVIYNDNFVDNHLIVANNARYLEKYPYKDIATKTQLGKYWDIFDSTAGQANERFKYKHIFKDIINPDHDRTVLLTHLILRSLTEWLPIDPRERGAFLSEQIVNAANFTIAVFQDYDAGSIVLEHLLIITEPHLRQVILTELYRLKEFWAANARISNDELVTCMNNILRGIGPASLNDSTYVKVSIPAHPRHRTPAGSQGKAYTGAARLEHATQPGPFVIGLDLPFWVAVSMIDDNAQKRNFFYDNIINKAELMDEVLTSVMRIGCDMNNLVEITFNGGESSLRYPSLNFDRLETVCTSVLSELKKSLSELRGYLPQALVERYERSVDAGGPNVVSVYYLEEHLMNRLFKNKYRNGLIDSNIALKEIWKYMTSPLKTNKLTVDVDRTSPIYIATATLDANGLQTTSFNSVISKMIFWNHQRQYVDWKSKGRADMLMQDVVRGGSAYDSWIQGLSVRTLNGDFENDSHKPGIKRFPAITSPILTSERTPLSASGKSEDTAVFELFKRAPNDGNVAEIINKQLVVNLKTAVDPPINHVVDHLLKTQDVIAVCSLIDFFVLSTVSIPRVPGSLSYSVIDNTHPYPWADQYLSSKTRAFVVYQHMTEIHGKMGAPPFAMHAACDNTIPANHYRDQLSVFMRTPECNDDLRLFITLLCEDVVRQNASFGAVISRTHYYQSPMFLRVAGLHLVANMVFPSTLEATDCITSTITALNQLSWTHTPTTLEAASTDAVTIWSTVDRSTHPGFLIPADTDQVVTVALATNTPPGNAGLVARVPALAAPRGAAEAALASLQAYNDIAALRRLALAPAAGVAGHPPDIVACAPITWVFTASAGDVGRAQRLDFEELHGGAVRFAGPLDAVANSEEYKKDPDKFDKLMKQRFALPIVRELRNETVKLFNLDLAENPTQYLFGTDGFESINNSIFSSNTGLIVKLNILLYRYVNLFFDVSKKTIYKPLVDYLTVEGAAEAIMYGNTINDSLYEIKGDSAIAQQAVGVGMFNFEPAPNTCLFATLALGIRGLYTSRKKTSLGVSPPAFLDEDLANVESYQKEIYRAYLPMFDKELDMLVTQAVFLKELIENLRIKIEKHTHISSFANRPQTFLNNKDIPGFTKKMLNSPMNESERKTYLIGLLNSVIRTAKSMQKCIQTVSRELADLPMFMETYKGSISQFSETYKEMPFTPLSQVTTAFNLAMFRSTDPKALHGVNFDYNNPEGSLSAHPPFVPSHVNSIGSKHFELTYGLRGILNPKNADILKYMPSVDPLFDKSITKTGGAANYSNLITNVVVLSRYLIDVLYMKDFLLRNNTREFLQETQRYDIGNLTVQSGMMLRLSHGRPAFQTIGRLGAPTANVAQVLDYETYWGQFDNLLMMSMNPNKRQGVYRLLSSVNLPNENMMFSSSRKTIRIFNILDLNLNPINVHALQRELPFINVFNFAYTFDHLVKDTVGIYLRRVPLNAIGGYRNTVNPAGTDVQFYTENEFNELANSTAEDALVRHLIFPMGFRRLREYYNEVYMIMAGNTNISISRPKYLSDQLWNKVLLNSLAVAPAVNQRGQYHAYSRSTTTALTRLPLHVTADYAAAAGLMTDATEPLVNGIATGLFALGVDYTTANQTGRPNNLGRNLTILQSDGSVASVDVGADVANRLAYHGYLRYNSRLIRWLEFFTNLQRVVRVFLHRQLNSNNPVVQGMEIVNEDTTEFNADNATMNLEYYN